MLLPGSLLIYENHPHSIRPLRWRSKRYHTLPCCPGYAPDPGLNPSARWQELRQLPLAQRQTAHPHITPRGLPFHYGFRLRKTSQTNLLCLANPKDLAPAQMNPSSINCLLGPLEAAARLQSWEDAEDIAREIARLCRLMRLCDLQSIQEALGASKCGKVVPRPASEEIRPF